MPDTSELRARFALERIVSLGGTAPGEYLSYVKSLPATILRSGLGQALTMEAVGKAKEGTSPAGHARLYGDMEAWLIGADGWPTSSLRPRAAALPAGQQANRLIQAVVRARQDEYVRAQAEALAYLGWLKKFAVAFLGNEED